jgi:Zn-dependent protease
MLRSFRLGSAFGIPLYVHWSLLLVPAVAALSQSHEGPLDVLLAVAVAVGVFGCVLLHELGHALAARSYGIRTRDITLYLLGGVARLEQMTEKPSQELVIALAGPAVNVAIVALLTPVLTVCAALGLFQLGGGVLSASGSPAGLLALFLLLLCAANVLLVLFNLLPAFPMDGGRVLRALLSLGMPRVRATEIASWVGVPVAFLVGLVGYLMFNNPWPGLVIAFVVFVAGRQELMVLRRLEAERRAAAAVPVEYVRPILPLGPELQPERPAGFSGLAWDREARVWVLWRDGRPVQVLG